MNRWLPVCLMLFGAIVGSLGSAMAQPANEQRTLRIVPFADLAVLDPINTTAGNVQSHAMHVYDFLFEIGRAHV